MSDYLIDNLDLTGVRDVLNEKGMKVTYIDLGLHKEAPELDMVIDICNKRGYSLTAYGIEANPTYIPKLREKYANDARVSIMNYAIGKGSGSCKLYISEAFDGEGSSIYPTKNNVKESDYLTVEMRSLSDLMQGFTLHPVTILKWNIEGAELPMMLDLAETGSHERVSLFCGATPDIHKVAEIKHLESDYKALMNKLVIDWFPFYSTPQKGLKQAMRDDMDSRLATYAKRISNP